MLVLPLPLLLLLLFLLFLSLLLFASPGLLEIEESGEEEGGENSAVSTRRPAPPPPPPPRDEKGEDEEEGIEAAAASSAAERDAPRFSAGNISFSFKARYFPQNDVFFFAEFRVFNTKSKRKGGETRKRERAEEIENITSTDDTIDTKIEKTITKWIFAIGPTNRK